MWSFLTAIMMMGMPQAEVVDGVWRRDDGANIIPLTYEEGFPMIYIPYEGEPLLRWSIGFDGFEGTQIEYVVHHQKFDGLSHKQKKTLTEYEWNL